MELPLSQVIPDPEQPRKYFNELKVQRLAQSIDRHGLLEAILVRPWNGQFMIVHGEMRYRACQFLKKQTIKSEVRELTEDQVRDIQLTENMERNDLTDIELAWEFDRRVKQGQTHEDIAARIQRTRSFVTQRLALLQLTEDEQQRMLRGELSFSNARLLLSVKDPNMRAELSEKIAEDTTVQHTLSLLKPENNNVTRVTMNSGLSGDRLIDVKTLAVYRLISERTQVPLEVLVQAYAQDLKTMRGGVTIE